MASASTITIHNKAGFDLKFYVAVDGTGLRSGDSGWFPIGQQRTIALNDIEGQQPGATVVPYVDAAGGHSNRQCRGSVEYQPDAGDMSYQVHGTTLDFNCKCDHC